MAASEDEGGDWKRSKRNTDLFEDVPGGHDKPSVVEGCRMGGEVGVVCGGVGGIH